LPSARRTDEAPPPSQTRTNRSIDHCAALALHRRDAAPRVQRRATRTSHRQTSPASSARPAAVRPGDGVDREHPPSTSARPTTSAPPTGSQLSRLRRGEREELRAAERDLGSAAPLAGAELPVHRGGSSRKGQPPATASRALGAALAPRQSTRVQVRRAGSRTTACGQPGGRRPARSTPDRRRSGRATAAAAACGSCCPRARRPAAFRIPGRPDRSPSLAASEPSGAFTGIVAATAPRQSPANPLR
jgi:hypothetical protein